MTKETLLSLHDQLRPDPWRLSDGFSDDIDKAQRAMLRASTPADAADALRTWLRSHQPCLFGRFAATNKRMTICVLREEDLVEGDDHVRAVIQHHRQAWREAALEGVEHSFVVALATERLAHAIPGAELLTVARRLLALYLPGDGVDDVVFDRLFLRVSREEPAYVAWLNGVNVFAAQGDKRWWRDHRIPGGLAFAMNAIGHMARTYVNGKTDTNAISSEEERARLIGWALPIAMQTIQVASKSEVGRRGSWLLPKQDGDQGPPFCPKTFAKVVGFDWRKYGGAFHTDHTIPSPFFRDAIDRPSDYSDFLNMDFSYLHDTTEADYELIGLGESAHPAVSEVLRQILETAKEND